MSTALPETSPVIFFVPNGAGGRDVLTVDATTDEKHDLTNTLTKHPVEQGFDITDHSRPEAPKVTLSCVVSNTPLDGNPAGIDLAAGLWQRFWDLHNSPQLVDVQTARAYYTSMGITNVSSPVDVKKANAFYFSITIEQVRVVQNKFTRVVVAKDTRAHPNRKQGAVTPVTLANSDPDARNVSNAFKLSGLPLVLDQGPVQVAP